MLDVGHAFGFVVRKELIDGLRNFKDVWQERCWENFRIPPTPIEFGFNRFEFGSHLGHRLVVRKMVEHETKSVQRSFVSVQDVGIARRGLNGQGGFLCQHASGDQPRARSDEGHSVGWRHHHPIPNPNQGHAEENKPSGHQIAGVVFHGGDGVQSHINGRIPLPFNAEHALIQGDFHPFRWFCQPEGQEGFLVRLAGWYSDLSNLAHPMSERGVRGYQTTAEGPS